MRAPRLDRTGSLGGVLLDGGIWFEAVFVDRCLDRRRGRFGPHELGWRPGETPSPKPKAHQVGGHRRQTAAVDLARDHRDADQGEAERQHDPDCLGSDRDEVVDAVGQRRHCGQGHDLREGEPEQDAVFGLHVGRHLVFIHGDSSFQLDC